MPSPCVVVLNRKGGTGKTSTCFHLSHALARKGRRVLLIDLDPQSNLSEGFLGAGVEDLPPEATVAALYSDSFVPDPRALTGFVYPVDDRFPAGVGEFIDALVRPGRLDDVLAADQAVTLQPLQRHVDLTDVRRRVGFAEDLLELSLQLIAVSRLLRQERQQGHSHQIAPSCR